MIQFGRDTGKSRGFVKRAGGRQPGILPRVAVTLRYEIQGYVRVQERTKLGTVLNQDGHVDWSSAQNGRQREYRDVKRTGIALELNGSAVRPTHASKEQHYAENERRSHKPL